MTPDAPPAPPRTTQAGSDHVHTLPIGSAWFRARGLLGAALVAPVAVLVLLSEPATPGGAGGAVALEVLAWALFLGGLGLRWWATLYLGGRKTRVVVCEGPYSVCRNPVYIGSLLLGLSMAAFLVSLTLAAAVLLASLLYAWATVPAEERALRQALGEEYVRYCARTPRFLPRVSLFHTAPVLEVSVRGLRIEARRALRLCAIPLLLLVLAHLRHATWWPHPFHLP